MAIWRGVVSMGGSNELVECFCGGAIVEGCSGAVARLVGDGVEVGLVAGDGGSFVSVRIAPSGRPLDAACERHRPGRPCALATNQQSRGGEGPHRGTGAASLGRRLAIRRSVGVLGLVHAART